MTTDLREKFEDWYWGEYRIPYGFPKSNRPNVFGRHEDGEYRLIMVRDAFAAYQAAYELTKSQDAVGFVINTPTMYGARLYGDIKHNTPIYLAPPNHEALVKDNERLREALEKIHSICFKGFKSQQTRFNEIYPIVDEALAKDNHD